MARNKLPSSRKLDDLLKDLESEDEDPSAKWIEEFHDSDDVVSFLTFYNIKPGIEFVKDKMLYKLYRTWSNLPLESIQFNRKVREYITGTRGYFKLNLDAFKINESILNHLKEHKQDKTKQPNWGKHYDNFLSYYNIGVGNIWIECYYLYHLYDMWTYKNKVKSWLGYKQFYNFCKLHFKHKRRGSSRMEWFSTSLDINTVLTKESIENIKKAHAQKK